jgi:hypothetical protein
VGVGDGTGVDAAGVAGEDVRGAALVAAALVAGVGTSIELNARPPDAHGCVPAAGPSAALALALTDGALVGVGVQDARKSSVAARLADTRRSIVGPSAHS